VSGGVLEEAVAYPLIILAGLWKPTKGKPLSADQHCLTYYNSLSVSDFTLKFPWSNVLDTLAKKLAKMGQLTSPCPSACMKRHEKRCRVFMKFMLEF
jgi:hypothetical protein